MYRAKRGGADRIEIFRPEMRADRDDRVALESDLRKALAKNQIKVLYQPIIYLPTEELAGFEALVRWEHPKRGLMSPDDFIPIAEQSDLIVRLGSHVLLRAAHEAARWQRELPREERAAVRVASTSRAGRSSARISSRRSATSSAATSCPRARCGWRSPRAW